MTELEQKLLDALKGVLSDIEGLMRESSGVYGLHLNGDVSPWNELDEGGRFERLEHLSSARAVVEEAEASRHLPVADADGWIPLTGGDCPVPGFKKVHVRRRDKSELIWDALALAWKHYGVNSDIIAYRVVKEPT